MGDLAVVIEQLTDASISASGVADDIDEGLRRFSTDVDALLSTWKGLSAAQFGEASAEWREDAESVLSVLRTAAGLLATAAQGYSHQETTTTDNIGRLAL